MRERGPRLRLLSFTPLALASLFLASLPSGGAAQGSIAVTDVQVTSLFPQGVRFTATVSGTQSITSVTLRYRVLGERVGRYDRAVFEEADSVQVDLLVRTDTADRYIPPGGELEYRFEVEDATGARMETEPRRFVLLDPRFEWRRLDESGGYILYHGPVADLARQVLAGSLETLERMGRLMGVSVEGPIRLTMYNRWDDMREALPPRSEVQERSLVTEGISFGNTGVILLLGGNPGVRGVTSHETVHFLMQQAMGGLTRLVPAWLNEGLAEYGSPEPGTSYDIALGRAVREGTLLPLTSITTPPGRPADVILFYGESKSVVKYLVETHGEEPLRRLLEALRDGDTIDGALVSIYGFDRNGLDDLWRESIGAPPLEATPVRSGIPTAIPRPTLVPFGAGDPSPTPTEAPSPPPPAAATPAPPAAQAGSCGRPPAGDAGAAPIDLLGAGPALGLMVLVGLVPGARRRRGHSGPGANAGAPGQQGRMRWRC